MQRGGGSGIRVVRSGGAYLTIVDGIVKVGRGSGVQKKSPCWTNVARARAGRRVLTSGAGASALRCGTALGAVISRGTGAGALISGAASGTVATSGAGAGALISEAAGGTVTTSGAGAGALISEAASGTVTTSGAGAGALVSGAASGAVSTSSTWFSRAPLRTVLARRARTSALVVSAAPCRAESCRSARDAGILGLALSWIGRAGRAGVVGWG